MATRKAKRTLRDMGRSLLGWDLLLLAACLLTLLALATVRLFRVEARLEGISQELRELKQTTEGIGRARRK